MNPKRQKMKDRRRARKLADEAWQAVDDDNLDLAEKIIRRAVAAQPDNPVLWNDQGLILGLRGNEAESAEAFRAAISMAPTYAEAFANLAALRIRQGFVREAIAIQEQAVKHTPENSLYAERLEAYRSLVAQTKTTEVQPTTDVAESSIEWSQSDSSTRLAALPWPNLADRLTRDGCVLIPGLVDASTCERLRGMFDDDVLFARTVVMDRPEFGLGTYRYFKAPLPLVVDHLRRAMFPYVARIANEWQKLLCEQDRFPDSWEAFREECAQSGQMTPTPLLLKYGAGGFNALHRDLRGGVFFPIQMAVVLSAHAETGPMPLHAFRGGEFLLCDVPEGKKAKRREIHAGLSDAILFCTRDRLVCVGGAYGLQPVKHGVAPITAGERFVLGVPFHEYR